MFLHRLMHWLAGGPKVADRYAGRRLLGLLVSLALGVVAAALYPTRPLDVMERKTWDWRFLMRGPRRTTSPVVLVTIDEPTVTYKPWEDEPMIIWGPHFAAVVRELKRRGASVVGFDVLQRISTESLARKLGAKVTFDAQFAIALAEAQNVVLVRDGDVEPPQQIKYADGTYPENIGVANFLAGRRADPDGIVRAFIPWWQREGLSSLAGRLVERHLGVQPRFETPRKVKLGGITVPLHRDGTMLINYVGPPGTLPSCSFWQVAEGKVPPGIDFTGKVVLIGEAYAGLQDLHLTPFSGRALAGEQNMPGVEVWGNAVDTILERRFLSTTEIPAGRLLLVGLALGTGILFLATRWLHGLIACPLLMAGWVALCRWEFARYDYLLLMFVPLALIPVNYALLTLYRYVTEEREKKHLEATWRRFQNPKVIDYIMLNPDAQQPGGQRKPMTVLFSDIRGFTSMSGEMAPEHVVGTLNEYFDAMAKLIAAREGIVDKYVGDAVMALWDVPMPCVDAPAPVQAVASAVEMVRKLEELNRGWANQKGGEASRPGQGVYKPLRIGIGINTGDAVAGNIGATDAMDFTAIGDTVNVASRLESVTKDYEVPIIISKQTWREITVEGPEGERRLVPVLEGLFQPDFAVRYLGPVSLKGRPEPVSCYAIYRQAPAPPAGEAAALQASAPAVAAAGSGAEG